MTRERLEEITREYQSAIATYPATTDDSLLLMWGETIKALEEAVKENERLYKNMGKMSLMASPDALKHYVTFSIQHDTGSNKLTIGLDHMTELRP